MRWNKVRGLEKITIKDFIILIAADKNKMQNKMVSWKTSDGLLHMTSIDLIKQFSNNQYDDNSIYTIWEKIL